MLNSKWDNQPELYARLRDCWLNRRRQAHVERFLAEARPGQVVLEVGSGTGGLLLALARARGDLEFHGVEPQAAYVEYARQQAQGLRLHYHVGFAEALPSGIPKADFVLCNDVVHHWHDVATAVAEITRFVNRGARWLAVEPNSLNPYVLLGQSLKPGERNFRPGRFVTELGSAGWRLREKSYLFLIPPFWRNPPDAAKRMERLFEGFPLVAGGVSLESGLEA